MAKLFLLDAYALIYRAYYGFIKNPRINSKGAVTRHSPSIKHNAKKRQKVSVLPFRLLRMY